MSNLNINNRTIFCHDNLEIMQGINSDCIDLIYLDPPFNKKKVFTAPIGSSAEGASFKDIFRQEDIKDEWLQTIKEDQDNIYFLLDAVKSIEGRTSYNFCYLAYMSIRLVECYRILKDTGSIYLHCDPTMSHYLKLVLDCIFGEKNFRNEIVWCYKGPGKNKKGFPKKHDIVLRFSKSNNVFFSNEDIRVPYSESFLKRRQYSEGKAGIFGKGEGKTRSYKKGKSPEDWWDDIPSGGQIPRSELVGYPTQKPVALLERIIKSSSNEGDIVLDPFCGCATTCVAAEKLNRQWVGIDVSHKAYELVKERLQKEVADPEDLYKYSTKVSYSTDPPKRTDQGKEHILKKYVYVISHPKYKGQYKVGIANNWKQRLNSYQTGDPDRSYEMEFKVLKENYRETEKYIHNKYDARSEWVSGNLKEIIEDIENY